MKHRLRCIVAGFALAAPLFLSACSDQLTEAPQGSITPAPGRANVVDQIESCPASSIEDQIKALATSKLLQNSLLSIFKSIPSKVDKRTGTAARDKMFALVDAILDAYYAGQFGGTSTAIQNKVLTLISSLYCFVRLDSPTLPAGSLGEDGVVGVVTPNSPTTTLATPSEHAAVTIPAGAAPTPTTIVIRKLDDTPGPLFTSLDQYPFFYEFSSFPEVTFNFDVLAGICPRDNLDAIDANLRLAHNVGPDFGDVEVLPRPEGAIPGLDCTDLDNVGFLKSKIFDPLARVLLPEPLHAAGFALATSGVGGTTKKYSPFGIVDQESNPASLGIVDEEGNPTSGTVSGPGMVFVKTTSQNGDPISRVPVDFDGTTVLTDESGIAGFNWTDATPGATLTATVPNEEPEGEGDEGCPSDIPTHAPDDPYRPFVCFTPDEVTFTAEGTENPIEYGSGGYRYILIGSAAPSESTPNYPAGQWFQPGFTPGMAWGTGPAPFGQSGAGCSIYGSHPVATSWPAAAGLQANPNTGSGLLVRRAFTTPVEFSGQILINVAIDNDIQLYLDGVDVTNHPDVGFVARTNVDAVNGSWEEAFIYPFWPHNGCAQRNDGTFTVPSSLVDPGTTHVIAVFAHDWGGASYFDIEVELDSGE